MVHMAEVGDLVGGDVVLGVMRGHDQAPTEGQGAVGGAASPAGFGVLHGDAPGVKGGQGGFLRDQGGKPAAGFLAEEIVGAPAEEFRGAGDDQLAVLQEGATAGGGGVANAVRFAGDGNDGAVGEADGIRQGSEAVGEPVPVVHQQRHAGTAAGAHGQGDDDGTAARVYAQADALGAGAAAPFHDGETVREFQHFGRRRFHGIS